MTTKTLPAETRVRLGAAWLDEHVPDWASRVTLPEFKITDKCFCVLGQVFRNDAEVYVQEHGEWTDQFPIMLRDHLSDTGMLASGYAWAVDNEHVINAERAKELGFDAVYIADPDPFADDELEEMTDYASLQREWRRVINERQSR